MRMLLTALRSFRSYSLGKVRKQPWASVGYLLAPKGTKNRIATAIRLAKSVALGLTLRQRSSSAVGGALKARVAEAAPCPANIVFVGRFAAGGEYPSLRREAVSHRRRQLSRSEEPQFAKTIKPNTGGLFVLFAARKYKESESRERFAPLREGF